MREWVQLYVNEVIHKYDPKFQVKYKKNSKLFKVLSPILKLICPRFFKTYVTTFGGVMWVPDYFLDDQFATSSYLPTVLGRLSTVAHEGVHVYDENRLKLLYHLMYFFPQILIVPFILLAIFHSLFWLFGLLALLPLPAPGRYYLELRGYRVRHIWNEYVYGKFTSPEVKERERFYTSNWVGYQMSNINTYYGTWPIKSCVVKDMQKPVDVNEKQYKDIIDFLKRHELM